MQLALLSITIIWIGILIWLLFWKITKFMLSLTIGVPYRWWFDSPYKNELPIPQESSALWVHGANGQYFRYDINVADEDIERQNDELTNFYRQQERSKVNV